MMKHDGEIGYVMLMVESSWKLAAVSMFSVQVVDIGERLTENIDVLLQGLCRVIAQLAAPFDFLKCAPAWEAPARELCDG
jgi:hypothetical protein